MKLKLQNVRISYPFLFVARGYAGSETNKSFSVNLLIPKGSKLEKDVRATLLAVAREKWPKNGEATLKTLIAQERTAFRDGDLKDSDGYEDHWYLACSSKERPTVVDRDLTPLAQDDGRPYAGCYCNVSVDIWAQDNQYGKRVNCEIKAVQFARDGDSFAAGGPPVKAEEEFEVLDYDEGDDI